jgi:hypothetical protein
MAAGGGQTARQRRRAPARLAERLLVERHRDGEADVDPDQVLELERPHAEAPAQAADAVDLGRRGEPLLDGPQGLEPERPPAAVDEEAGAVGGGDHPPAHGRAGAARERQRLLARRIARHHLDKAHERRRIEEVHADNALGPGHGSGDLRH